MNEIQQQLDARSARIWAVVVLAGSVVLFFAGGGLTNLRPPGAGAPEPAGIPVALEPSGEQPSPPTVFRWTPGRPDAVTQVTFHRLNFKPLWSSEPLRGVSELEVPLDIYEGLGAGEPFQWRVREAWGGKASGSSAYTRFSFRVDANGYGPGQAPELFEYLE